MSEIWKPVVGYEGFYEVSDYGRVRRVAPAQGTRPGYVLDPVAQKNRGGYLAVGLRKPGEKRRLLRVHRMVAEAFYGVSDMPLVRHLDGDVLNNRVENLRHGTVSENAQDRTLHGNSRSSNQYTDATHCRNGHEYTPENTKAVRANGGIGRRCRTCLRLEARRRYWRKKELRAA